MYAQTQLSLKVLPANVAPVPGPPFDVTFNIPALPISTTHPDWPYLLSLGTKYAAGSNQWAYGFGSMLQVWAADGRKNDALRDAILVSFRAKLASMMAKWDLGQNVTDFAADSYLYAADLLCQIVVVDNWLHSFLTTEERSQLVMLCEQCIYNVWNPSKATWGGVAYHWSGWATNNPYNNYFFRSHFRGTLYWAYHSQNPQWLSKINDYCIPLIKQKYDYLVGGGSLEGTGYGSAIWNLFECIYFLKQIGGVDLTADCRVAEFLDYWVNAFTPGFGSVAQFGDTPSPNFKDVHRGILVWGIMLVPTSKQAEHARAVLKTVGIKAARPEYLLLTTYDSSGTATEIDYKTYHATGVGHLFAKDLATQSMLTVDCKTAAESHDHLSEGEFQFYKAGWKLVTANYFSHSGIVQGTRSHNCLSFTKLDATTPILQKRSTLVVNTMSYSDDGNLLSVSCDLTPCYTGTDVTSHKRQIVWDRALKNIKVSDQYTGAVIPSWRCFVWSLPTVDLAAGTVTNADFIFKPSSGVKINVQDLHDINATEYALAGRAWMIEFTGFTGSVTVEIQGLY